MSNLYNFNLSGYETLLKSFTDAGYTCDAFAGTPSPMQTLYLRHDVDFSPAAALRIAEIEADMGLFSHFYFLPRSPFYNLFSDQTRSILKALDKMRHKIGLHLDPKTDEHQNLEAQAKYEKSLVELASDTTCKSVSLHRPSPVSLGKESQLGGMTACYGNPWFKDIKYCSDSTGRWRYGKPTDTEAFINRESIQLLTHPIWWYLEHEDAPEHRLNTFLNDCVNYAYKSIKANSSVTPSVNLNDLAQ